MPILAPLVRSGNLPAPISRFIGREDQLAAVEALLGEHRLITLTGAGGSGKTRLALAVAERCASAFPDGVAFVDFAPVTDEALLAPTLAAALGLAESRDGEGTTQLVTHLHALNALLIFDNCEHVAAGAARLAEAVLSGCASMHILVTSRERLAIVGEQLFPVPPLALPEPVPWQEPADGLRALALLQASEAGRLFLDRAATVAPDFVLSSETSPAVAEICRRLDGLPLAIELAAARVRSLSVRQIADRLDDRFHLLTGGSRTAHPRQQTLEATLDWSYDLLDELERHVLQCCSVFVGGWTLEAAEVVCSDEGFAAGRVLDALTNLVDRSLVVVSQPGDDVRYGLLETIRTYAQARLAAAPAGAEAHRRHLSFFVDWTEANAPRLLEHDPNMTLLRFEADHDNIRHALDWAAARPERADEGLRLAAACGHFWRIHGHLGEGRLRLERELAREGIPTTVHLAQARYYAASLAYFQSDFQAARHHTTESLRLWQSLGTEGRNGAADALVALANIETELGHYEQAWPMFEAALAQWRELGDALGIGNGLMQTGYAELRIGRYDEAATHLQEALVHLRASGFTTNIGFTLAALGELALRRGRLDEAERWLAESADLRRETGELWGVAASLGSMAWVALLKNDYERLRATLGESMILRRRLSDAGGLAWCFEKLAGGLLDAARSSKRRSDLGAAVVRLLAAAHAVRERHRAQVDPADAAHLADLNQRARDAIAAERFDELWNDSQALSLDEATDAALAALDLLTSTAPAPREAGPLTAREQEVAALIAQGKPNREIAATLVVGVKTVETYVTRILNKLGLDSRVQIATWAIENGVARDANGARRR